MILLPEKTIYGKRMPKEKFYSHLELSPSVKRSFIDDVDYFIWQNKLSPSTINVDYGKQVKEIAIFEVYLKHQEYNPSILEMIDRNVPVYIVYLLRYESMMKLVASYKEPVTGKSGSFKILETFATNWTDERNITINIDGHNLDIVYNNFVRQIAGERLRKESATEDITADIQKQQYRENILRQIEALESKRRKEKQFNRQIEINEEIKKLKGEI